MNTNDFAKAFDALMQETPYSHFDSGCEGIIPECRTCRFHRPFWKYQSCVFAECPYCCNPVSIIQHKLLQAMFFCKRTVQPVVTDLMGADNPLHLRTQILVEKDETVSFDDAVHTLE